ncbi:peptidoglycan editing factor PgeF [Deinococcus sp. MIMF12]|uniref:Purine nucleoside phosphorylase n=1 Tax=Deinococcus rhizophilus TaxID=3049544 RepID=A0ABT7JFQ1_9DEIO|nr:peptidoglycan editing factor PgeF [Deinococcus rhizophilus]MDL2343889.1 peptidoglycan editing factor PgeF [Deinococcus rhizophilus]
MRPDTDPLMFLRSPALPLPHAFTTRAGGVSLGAYAGLNLDDREDDPQAVAENRRRVAEALGFAPSQVARLNQVHGTDVREAQPGVQDGDALVSNEPGLLLAIGTADCYPILLADVEAGVVGAAHAGWRGTLGRIAARTVEAMVERGANPANIRAAVGPGICGERYAVGADVARQFRDAGLGAHMLEGSVLERPGGPHLDLAGANRAVLLAAGVTPGHLWVSGRCSTEADFYSYRRDAGRTGRMWAVIGLPDPSAGLGVDA